MNRFHIRTPRVRRSINAPNRGFTLLEVLVAVAAVAIIATGLAAIFDSVGKTVTAGRRVSRVNQYGRLLEQQLRRDFMRMTRDGFLAIRQQFADGDGDGQFEPGDPSILGTPRATVGADDIPLYEDQPRANGDRPSDEWRARRIDEVLFFSRGEAKSARVAMGQTGWAQPTSKESMIYYGHGMRMNPEADEVDTNTRPYSNPKVNETNSIARNVVNPNAKHLLGYHEDPLQPDEEANPNVYASKWILLRKQTLLIPPTLTAQNRQAAFEFTDPLDAHLKDYDCQVAGQPAAPSVFRSLNRLFTPDFDTSITNSYATPDTHLWFVTGNAGNYIPSTGGPLLSSGIVDIATTSLAEIKSFVTGYANTDAAINPLLARIPGNFINNGLINPNGTFLPSTQEFGNFGGALPYRGPNPADWDTPDQRPDFLSWEAIDYMHAWMDNAFPTRASVHGDLANTPSEGDFAAPDYEYQDEDRGVRIRCEEFAPDLLDKLRPAPTPTPAAARAAFYQQADRLALAASNLVVGCSEFAVDWTLGASTANVGDVVWYGPQTTCGFYEYVSPCGNPSINSRVYVSGDSASSNPADRKGGRSAYPYTERLIYGYNANALRYRDPGSDDYPLSVSSFFGYVDPTYSMDVNRNGTIEPGEITSDPTVWADLDNPNVVDPGEMEPNPSPSSRRWIWPTMIRVRVTIADPVDPSIESTFEYVFDVPDDQAR